MINSVIPFFSPHFLEQFLIYHHRSQIFKDFFLLSKSSLFPVLYSLKTCTNAIRGSGSTWQLIREFWLNIKKKNILSLPGSELVTKNITAWKTSDQTLLHSLEILEINLHYHLHSLLVGNHCCL